MQIRWSVPATEDLERICERIGRDNPETATAELPEPSMRDAPS
jgi:plasmid stabilization system protein ParE